MSHTHEIKYDEPAVIEGTYRNNMGHLSVLIIGRCVKLYYIYPHLGQSLPTVSEVRPAQF